MADLEIREENIGKDITETGYICVDWIKLTYDTIQRRILVTTVMKLQDSIIGEVLVDELFDHQLFKKGSGTWS